MDYNSVVFREFTPESYHRTERYRRDEAERLASDRLQRQTIREDEPEPHNSMRKPSRHEPSIDTRKPNKELAVGQTLPRSLQTKFPAELIGKPIEEIDWYYRTEHVRARLSAIVAHARLRSRSSWLSTETRPYFGSARRRLVISSLHLIVVAV